MGEAVLDEKFLFSNFQEQQPVKSKSKKGRKRKLSDCVIGDDGLPIVELPEGLSKLMEQKDKYIDQLEEQNNKLKSVIKRLCGPQNFTEKGSLWEPGSMSTMPMSVVLLMNNELSFGFKKDVEELMFNLLQSKNGKIEDKSDLSQQLKSQQSAIPLRAFTVNPQGKRQHIAKNSSKDAAEPHIYSAVHYYLDFCIDRTGLPLLEYNPGITEVWAIPIYEQVFFNALPAVDDDGKKISVKQMRSRSCFNCLGDHNLSQCDQPRDTARINANRQDFASRFGGSSINESRYHGGEQERFKSFKAGVISDNLREALSISKEDLPPYIYKMRSLGYPPGYMKSSKTGLLMYGKEGQIQDNNDGEEGEIQRQTFSQDVKYPGFNSPMEEGVIDRSFEFGLPPFEEWHYFMQNRSIGSSPSRQMPFSPQDNFNRMEGSFPGNAGISHEDMELDETHNRYENKGIMHYSPVNGARSRQTCDKQLSTSTPDRGSSLASPKPPPPLPTDSPDKVPPPPDYEPGESADKNASTAIKIGEMLEEAEIRARQVKALDSYLAQGQSMRGYGSSHQQWWNHEPLSDTAGILYFTCTPPPSLRAELSLSDIFKYSREDLDREPWKTDSTSWYDPLYGDLAAPTGIYDSIKEVLKRRRRMKLKKVFN